MKHLWPWLLAALAGALMGLCFPPFDQAGMVWFAVTPLIAALWFSPQSGRLRPLRLFGLGYLAGLTFFWVSLFWINEVTHLGWFIFAFYLALFNGAWALFVGIVCRPRDPVPGQPLSQCQWLHSFHNLRLAVRGAAAWAGLEWLRGTLFTGFGWNAFGVALWKNIALIQIADFSGVAGVSFLIVLVNLILVISVRRIMLEAGRVKLRPHFDFTITMALLSAAVIYGIVRVKQPRGESWLLAVAAVQANIPQGDKWNPEAEQDILNTYLRLTDVALAKKPDLLIWPEAATPRPVLDNEDLRKMVLDIMGKLQTNFLLGSIRYAPPFAYNSAILFTGKTGLYSYYDKMHLVPFGEYVPLRHTFPLFAWIVGDEVPDDFDFGAEPVVMELYKKPFHIAPLICFEDTLGDLTRRFAQRGAELLTTVTNDGWFRHSTESRQHLANAVFRCAETKLPLVRVANTGVTCFVDPFGQVTRTLDDSGNTFVAGVLYGTVPIRLDPPKTFYTNYGDLFAMVCFFGALLSIRVHFLTARRAGLSET